MTEKSFRKLVVFLLWCIIKLLVFIVDNMPSNRAWGSNKAIPIEYYEQAEEAIIEELGEEFIRRGNY